MSVSSQIYPWQRFWYERGAVLNLVDGGYLPDPQSEQERLLNPSVISFTANEKQHCLVLLGEPGMGKSIAARQEARSIEDGQGVKSAWFDLRGYSTEGRVVEKVLKGPEVTAWSRNDSQLHLFLDSFDECWPKVTNLPRVLCEELKAMPLERLYLRIICRTALWPSSFEQLLAEVLGESGVTVLELAPLRKCDVQTAATANGLDTEDFLSEIERRRVVPLAGRPVTLNFLLGVYAKDRKLPDNQWDLYERGCLSLCDEPDTERREAPMPIETSARQRLNIASWVATLTVLCARSGIRPAASAAETGEESCLSLDNLRPVSGLALDGLSALTNIGLRETLNTGLFAAQGPSILGWSHQTFAEFLCARFLHDIGAPVRQLRPIFENHGRIVPQLRGVASWLSACDDDLRDYLLREDPETLLLSDALFTTDLAKSGLVDALLAKSGLGDRLATDLDSFGYYGKLDNKHLAAQLRPYVSSKNKAPSQRDLAIEIAHACRAGELLSDLANVALDVSEDLRLRASAAMAISRYGDPAAKRRLRPLALGEAGDDPNDDLRGYGLACVWPEHMTADELFASLKEPEDVSYFGGYEMFLAYDLPAKLRPADLPAALAWLNGRERHQYYSDPFDRVASQIMWLAWTEYDSQGVAGPFAMAVLRRLEAYADVMGRGRRDDFVQQLGVNSDRRRRLALQLMRHLAGRTDRSSYLLFWRSQILKRPDDFGWVLRLYGETLGDAALKAVLLDVIPAMIDSNDRSQVDAVFGAAQNDGSLREAFAWLFGPIPLDSSAASSLRERWKREQRAAQESPAPVVKRRGPTASELLEWIVRFDAGDTSAWWKLNLWMMVDADGQVSDDSERVWDITRLPGWALLDEAARTKVTETARTYLERASPEISRWLHRNVFFRPAAAGYRALVLLRNRAPAVYSALTREVWLTWTPAVLALAAPWVAGDEALHLSLVADAYSATPRQLLRTLSVLIRKEARGDKHILVVASVRTCWDAEIARVILEEVREPGLNLESAGDLLDELLMHHDPAAIAYTNGLLGQTGDNNRQRLTVAASALARHAGRSGWSTVLATMHRDLSMGREIFERIVRDVSFDVNPVVAGLSDDQLADLYLLLLAMYPPERDMLHTGGAAFMMSPRDMVVQWPSAVLNRLISSGSRSAVDAMQRLIASRPNDPVLQRAYFLSLDTMRRSTWRAPSVKDLAALPPRSGRRYVATAEQLAEVVLESLERLQADIKSSQSGAYPLWDRQRKQSTWAPKDEAASCDQVADFLRRDLGSDRGVVVNREVRPRRGEATDIYVDSVAARAGGNDGQFTYVIEAKGCWHPDLMTAMETQLVGRYLNESRSRHGLYLVAWYNCDKWDRTDPRYKAARGLMKDKLKEYLEAQASELSSNRGVDVRVAIIDASLP